ncbi:MAG: hypothetical protein K0U20_08000, partial [Proteobacteria bacterium]|nr:hypothetical protein [Pseudomonadota bacterium]
LKAFRGDTSVCEDCERSVAGQSNLVAFKSAGLPHHSRSSGSQRRTLWMPALRGHDRLCA